MKEESKNGRTRKMAVAVIGVTLGVVLMFLGSFGGFGSSESSSDTDVLSAEDYRAQVEERIRTLCSAVRGAGEVQVFVTLSGGYEYVYSQDEKGECVTVGSGSSERAVVESVRSPEIMGVGIVCAGARDPAVKQALTELVSSALGIGTNRIVVAEGK